MTIKKKPSAKPRAAKPKTVPSIPECPAFPRCKELKVSCEICLTLGPDEWREHVKAVLSRVYA